MFDLKWITDTGWDLDKYFGPKEIPVTVVANTLVTHYKPTNLNIFLYSEPPEIVSGINTYVLDYWKMYDHILTWDVDILDKCPNASLFMYLDPWVTTDMLIGPKFFELSFLRGTKNRAQGHKLRLRVFDNQDRITIKKNFNATIPYDKVFRHTVLFANDQFNLAIENSRHNNYFTEKIMDCFLTLTIPVYWGCPNIGDYFNLDGIVVVNSEEDLYNKVNSLDENYYKDHLEAVIDNYTRILEMTKDLGEGGYKTLDRKIDELIRREHETRKTNNQTRSSNL